MIESCLRRLLPSWLGERDALGLAALRVFIGLIGFVSALRFIHYGWVDELFVTPRFFFKYWFAPFVVPLGQGTMFALFLVLAAASVLIALGALYRPAALTYSVVLTYVHLIDVTNYLNHYYFLSLLTFLMALMPLGDVYGVDGWVKRYMRRDGASAAPRTTVPGWCYVVLRFQVGVVYTFAGLAKVTEDWLIHAQPLSIWLASRTSMPILGPVLAQRWAPHVMGWAGCLFDLTIVWWLLFRRTRAVAFALVLVFHALTRLLFPIGMFPFIMVAAATVFFDPSWPRRFAGRFGQGAPPSAASVTSYRPRLILGLSAFALYGAVQILVPLRAFAYRGNVLWHEQGMRFSWRVMVREKNAAVTYLVEDARTGRTIEVHPRRYLDARQEREFATQPDLVLQLGHHIAHEWRERTGMSVRVRVEALASLNGRRAGLLIDPQVDLATTPDGLAAASWILPTPPGRPPFLHASR